MDLSHAVKITGLTLSGLCTRTYHMVELGVESSGCVAGFWKSEINLLNLANI